MADIRDTLSNDIIVFPLGPNDGDIHIHSGVEYTYKDGRWVVVPIDIEELLGDRYVRSQGDTMSGALICPMFSGHYDLDLLNELPL